VLAPGLGDHLELDVCGLGGHPGRRALGRGSCDVVAQRAHLFEAQREQAIAREGEQLLVAHPLDGKEHDRRGARGHLVRVEAGRAQPHGPLRALQDEGTAGEVYELCGPDRMTLAEIVRSVRDRLGLKRAVIGIPDFAARLQAAICDFVPGKPFSTDNYKSLLVDSVCRVNGLARLGIRPQSFDAVLPGYLA